MIDNKIMAKIKGEHDWGQLREFDISSGKHSVSWNFKSTRGGGVANIDELKIQSPFMVVRGNGQFLTNGSLDKDCSLISHTDFRRAMVGHTKVTRTFTIRNTGDVDMRLSGEPLVKINACNDFTLSRAPEKVIAPGKATSFDITFTPTGEGVKKAHVEINSNALRINDSYDFCIRGLALTPKSEVFPKNLQLPKGWKPTSSEGSFHVAFDNKFHLWGSEGMSFLESDPTSGENTGIEYTGNFKEGEVTFKVRTPRGSLSFYIDDEKAGEWSGWEYDWREVCIPIKAGKHTVKWLYKGGSS